MVKEQKTSLNMEDDVSHSAPLLTVLQCKNLILEELKKTVNHEGVGKIRGILMQCGWRAQIKQQYVDYIKRNGPTKINVENMIKAENRSPHVSTLIPAGAKNEIEKILRQIAARIIKLSDEPDSGTVLSGQYSNSTSTSSSSADFTFTSSYNNISSSLMSPTQTNQEEDSKINEISMIFNKNYESEMEIDNTSTEEEEEELLDI